LNETIFYLVKIIGIKINLSLKNLQTICTETLKDNKAENILSLDINGISSFADTIIIATANSNRHAKSLSEKLVESLKSNKKNILNLETTFEWTTARERTKQEMFDYFEGLSKL